MSSAGDPALLLRLVQQGGGFVLFAFAQADRSRQALLHFFGRLGEELGHAAIGEELPAGDFRTHELAEQCNPRHVLGILLGHQVQVFVHAVEIAREAQHAAQVPARVDVAGFIADLLDRGRDRVVQPACLEKFYCTAHRVTFQVQMPGSEPMRSLSSWVLMRLRRTLEA